ncbi:PAS domain S-box protein [Sphingomonas jatrophae]|uniref:histidine kinase n=1 Tax=Sphingomonas jatrophae TaxID=1166337 RepID=A0A1I6L444_9SPHN|nr:PAS domain S-box protein [Sphingomonas jatrophae]SFR98219.1 PAS domain S-box-containing protein [Sphingomonas jatrophae]
MEPVLSPAPPAPAAQPPAARVRAWEGLSDFAQIADFAPVAMWVTGPARTRLYVNQFYADFVGLRREEALAFDWRMLIHPDDRARLQAESEAGEARLERFVLEGRFCRGDGAWRWLQSTSQPIWDVTGTHIGFIGVAHDVTEAREAAQAIADKEAQLSAFIGQTTAGFAQVDLTGRFTLVNDRFCAIAGRSREDLLGLTMQAITHPQDLAGNVEKFERAVRDGTSYTHEKRFVRPDGTTVWVNNSVAVIRRADGTPYGVLAACLDVSERRAADSALRRSEERLRLATEGAGMATWEIDLATFDGPWSDNRFDLLGLPRDPNGRGTLADWLAVIHPDDAAWVAAAMRRCFKEGTPVELEYRILRADDGSERWLHSHGRRVERSDGRAPRFVGVSFDVTRRRAIEDEVRRSEWQFRTIFEQANDFIFTTGLDKVVTSCNPAVCAALGYTEEEAVGRPFSDFLADGDVGQADEMLRRKLKDGGTTRHTIRVRTSSGEVRLWEVSSRLNTGPDGQPVGLHAIARDVTDAQRAQEMQQLLINELNHRVKNTLAIVQGIAVQTFKSDDPAAARAAFADRLRALSDAHNLLTREVWGATTIDAVAAEALAAHDPDRSRITIDGPEVRIAPKTAISLALALHELATNALKHGALGTPAGTVRLAWQITSDAADTAPRLQLSWIERGGPPVALPDRRGFGSRLIERALAAELGGSVTLTFAPAGVECRIDAPLPEPA